MLGSDGLHRYAVIMTQLWWPGVQPTRWALST